jgi:hypothetical protein
MQPLSAIDAISPAWDHTRKLLLSPMRWQTLLKIGIVAFFAEGAGSSFRSSSNRMGGANHLPMHLPAIVAIASLVVLIGFVLLLLAFAFFYLSSRLQFVLFDVVLRRTTVIGPIWNRYGPATWRWMALRFLLSLVALALLAPILVPAIITFIQAIPKDGSEPNLGAFLGPLLAFVGAIFLVVILVGICNLLLRDFGLPSMALEGTSLQETVARIFRFIGAEPLQVFIFVVMRVLLQLVIGIGVAVVFAIGAVILLIPLGGLGGILWATMHHGDIGLKIFMWCALAVLALVFLAIVLAAGFMFTAVVQTFFQAYALYFLGGRYPLLGEILQPTPPIPQPSFYYPPPEPAAP